MTKLEELRALCSKMVEKTTDTEMIKQSAVIANKLDEVEAEVQKQQDDYKELLTGYKDMVLHSSYKPKVNEVIGTEASLNTGSFDMDAAIEEYVNKHNK